MLGTDDILLYLLTFFAGIGGFAFFLLVLWILFPEKVERWANQVRKLLAFVSERNARRYIAKDIELNVNAWQGRLCEECPGVAPYSIKVNWINVDNVESFLKDGTLVLKMKNHRNQSKNLAIAVKEYVPNALMPTARRYVKPKLMSGIDYVISKSILSRDTSALSYFLSVSELSIASDHELGPLIEELDLIHQQGLLTRILLSQYIGLSILQPSEPTDEVRNETVGLEKKMYELVNKRPKENVDSQFLGSHIRVAIVPIAKFWTLETVGTDAHVGYISRAMKGGVQTFYIVAAGDVKRYAKEVVTKSVRQCGLSKMREEEFTGTFRNRRESLYCALLTKK